MVTTDVYDGVKNAKSGGTGSKGSYAAKTAKEKERLKADGKCPVCSGVGRSPDGNYVCEACKGTGKYTNTDNKQK